MFEGDPHENLKRDLRRLADDVGEMRRALFSGQRESVERLKHEAGEKLHQAREHAQVKVKEVDTYVKDNPWVAVGIAAAAGAILGALIGQSKRR